MGLSTFEPEVHPISFKAKGQEFSFTVRGLNLTDISYLVGEHIQDIETGVVLFQQGREAIEKGGFDSLLLMLCRDVPGLVAEVISTVADEPDHVQRYAKLPFSVSVIALAEVLRMTVEEQGGLKNLSAALVTILKDALPANLRAVLEPRLQEMQSETSIGESEKT